MISGIYAWKLDGIYKYIGQGIDVEKRMMNNHSDCNALKNAIEKYGYDIFEKEIICYCDIDELDDLEIYYIKELHTHKSEGGYNISWGGSSPMRGRTASEETRQKMSDSNSGENHPNFGKHLSEETKQKISIAHIGMRHSKKSKEKMRIASTGRHFSEETKRKVSENHADVSGENHPMWGLFGKDNPKFGKKYKNSSSKYIGVYKRIIKGKHIYWLAQVRINGKTKQIGEFKSELLAAQAYNNYIIEHELPNPLNKF